MGSLGGLTSLRNKFLFPFAALTLALSFLLAYWVWDRSPQPGRPDAVAALIEQQRAVEQRRLEIEAYTQRTSASLASGLASTEAASAALASLTTPNTMKALHLSLSALDLSVRATKALISAPTSTEVAPGSRLDSLRAGWHRLPLSSDTTTAAAATHMLLRTAVVSPEGRHVGWLDSVHRAEDVSVASLQTSGSVAARVKNTLPKVIAAALLPLALFGLVVGFPLYKALRDIDHLAYVTERFRVGSPIDLLPMQRPDELGRIARAVAALSMRVAKADAKYHDQPKSPTTNPMDQIDAIEKQRQTLARSMEQLRQFAAVVEAAYEGIIVLDRRFRIEYVNPAFAADFRMSVGSLKGLRISELFHAEATASIEQFEPVLDLGVVVRETVRCKRADSVEFYAELTASPVRDERGGITSIVVVERDVTASVMSSELMTQQLLIDPLTEVWRRSALVTEMERRAARADRSPFSVLFVDLDGFKMINDRFGHEAGDTVLRSVGGVLKSQVRENDVVGRYGGDEFVILIDDDAKESNARRVAQRIVTAVPTVTGLRYPDVRFAASVGIASFPRDADTVTDVVRCADHAMYAAKRAGGARSTSWSDLKSKPSWNSTPPAAEVLTLRRRG
jgi:diguanylate cyclase (GGDEF)-like protein/PAS domain S-box-containing protein